MIKITNEVEGFELLEKLLSDDNLDLSGIEFEGWPSFSIRIQGKDFDGSVPTRIMPALLELQRLIHKSYCETTYGSDSLRKLTKEDKEQLELVVKVDKGSSIFDTVMDSALMKLVTAAGSKMTPEQITLVAIVLALTLSTTVMWRSYQARKTREFELDQEVRLSDIDKEKMQLMADGMKEIALISSRQASVIESTTHVRDELLTKLKPEDQLHVNPNEPAVEGVTPVSITGNDAKALTTKPRESAVERMVSGEFSLVSADFSAIDNTRFVVERKSDNYQFRADVPLGVLDDSQMVRLRDNSWNRVEVTMSILVRELHGRYTSAKVVSVE